jgi:signal transduction histidine kinase
MESTDPAAPQLPTGGEVTDRERIELLQLRLQREREARRESERIAELGLRRLWESKDELDRRVEERTAQLRVAQQQAQAASDAKTEFLANLGHEVHTPLQTILAALELATPTAEAERERHHDAIAAVLELRELFNDLLDLAECEVGSIEFYPVPTNLDEIADELVGRWQGRLAARGLLLVPESHGTATVDPVRLDRIADALLANGEKFSDPGTIELRMAAGDDGTTEVEVRDLGPGVAADQLERIFEPFVQAEGGNDRTTRGAGIGLALVRGLAREMGGEASAQPTPEGGLAVLVRIPGGTP